MATLLTSLARDNESREDFFSVQMELFFESLICVLCLIGLALYFSGFAETAGQVLFGIGIFAAIASELISEKGLCWESAIKIWCWAKLLALLGLRFNGVIGWKTFLFFSCTALLGMSLPRIKKEIDEIRESIPTWFWALLASVSLMLFIVGMIALAICYGMYLLFVQFGWKALYLPGGIILLWLIVKSILRWRASRVNIEDDGDYTGC